MRGNWEWGTDVELLACATMLQTPVSTFLNGRWISYCPRFFVKDSLQMIRLSGNKSSSSSKVIYLTNTSKHYSPVVSIPKRIPYELTAVVNHLGSSTETGHYTTLLKCGRQQWVRCNDSSISEVDGLQALEESSSTGYMFFYKASNCGKIFTEEFPLLSATYADFSSPTSSGKKANVSESLRLNPFKKESSRSPEAKKKSSFDLVYTL